MLVREIEDKAVLNQLVAASPRSQFLQTWEWGEFQQATGRDIYRLGVFDQGKILGSAQLVRYPLPFGQSYLYCPRGPIIDNQLPVKQFQTAFQVLLRGMVEQANKSGAAFLRIEPPLAKHQLNYWESLLKEYAHGQAGHVQPQHTWMLELNRPAEDLLAQMHQKTRYNIRLAEKKGVRIRTSQAPADLDKFLQLNAMTTKRDDFNSHPKRYYQTMLKALANSPFITIYVAELNGEVLAANLVISFGDTVTYLHGASSDNQRQAMAPHVLQWRQIESAQQQGYTYYDFWGVAPEGVKDHSWSGITRFKKGFGGHYYSYVGAYDLILSKVWYKMYKLATLVRS